jgi:hypothetical protein
MTTCRPSLRLALGAVLALSTLAAAAATSPLSENEMSGVYGRGLTEPTLAALGAAEQSGASASASASDAAAALNGASAGSAQEMDRQLTQQRLQAAATGMQATLKLSQALSAVSATTAVIGLAALPVLGFPFGFGALSGLQQQLANGH